MEKNNLSNCKFNWEELSSIAWKCDKNIKVISI